MIVISPYAKPHPLVHTQYDFGSILKFIEQTFDLGSLGDERRSRQLDRRQLRLLADAERVPDRAVAVGGDCGSGSGNAPNFEQIIDHDNGVPE